MSLTAICFPKSITISSTLFLVNLLTLLSKFITKSPPFSPAPGIVIFPVDGAFVDGAFITICSVLLTLLVLSNFIGIDTGFCSDISTALPSASFGCNTTELFSLFNIFLISPVTSTLLLSTSIEALSGFTITSVSTIVACALVLLMF